jgi:hypothetical protein
MEGTVTARKFFDKAFDIEGRRLAYETAADLLYEHCCTTDIGPPKQVAKAVEWFGVEVPEAVMWAVVNELRQKAKELGTERAKLERARVVVDGQVDTTTTSDYHAGTVQPAAARPTRLRVAG